MNIATSAAAATRNCLRGVLVVTEIALTLVLLVAAGLLMRTMTQLSNVDKGFDSHNLLTMNLGLPNLKYPKPENQISFFKEVTERIAALPGVKAVGTTSVLPLSDNFDGRGLAVEDHPKPRGEETVDGVDCWVLQARPRQILQGQRFFDGLIWVDKKGYNIVRMEGQAVPQIRTTKTENLFPRFTTIRKPVDGTHWFPIYTYADDTLQFRTGPQRIRLRIAYTNYKRFGVESTFTPR